MTILNQDFCEVNAIAEQAGVPRALYRSYHSTRHALGHPASLAHGSDETIFFSGYEKRRRLNL